MAKIHDSRAPSSVVLKKFLKLASEEFENCFLCYSPPLCVWGGGEGRLWYVCRHSQQPGSPTLSLCGSSLYLAPHGPAIYFQPFPLSVGLCPGLADEFQYFMGRCHVLLGGLIYIIIIKHFPRYLAGSSTHGILIMLIIINAYPLLPYILVLSINISYFLDGSLPFLPPCLCTCYSFP